MRHFTIALTLTMLAACAHVPNSTPWCPTKVNCRFDGLEDTMPNDGILHLLVVHGMGPQQVGYSRGLVTALSKELGWTPAGGGGVRRIIYPKDCTAQAILAIRRFFDDQNRPILVYEVTWAPTVDPLKQALDYDSDPVKLSQRTRINRGLKQHLINERFADPVLYVGFRRAAMQYPVQYTLCELLGGGMSDAGCGFQTARALDSATYPSLAGEDKVAIITFSLGSKLTFDALTALLTQKESGADVASRLQGKIGTFFMLANQLPLLELADRDALASGTIPLGEIGRVLRFGQSATPAFSVVAMSDPNDLLSYDVSDTFALLAPDINFANVNIRLGKTYGNIFADPLQAHTDHVASPVVIKYIARGYP